MGFQQQEILTKFPEAHSLLTSYLALNDPIKALEEFAAENSYQTLLTTQEQLKTISLKENSDFLIQILTNKNLETSKIINLLNNYL